MNENDRQRIIQTLQERLAGIERMRTLPVAEVLQVIAGCQSLHSSSTAVSSHFLMTVEEAMIVLDRPLFKLSAARLELERQEALQSLADLESLDFD